MQKKFEIKADIQDAIILDEHIGPMKAEEIPSEIYHTAPERSLLTLDGQKHATKILRSHLRSRITPAFSKTKEAAMDTVSKVHIEVPAGKNKRVQMGFERKDEDGSLKFYCEPNF